MPTKLSLRLGATIRELRKANNMTQAQAAHYAGMPRIIWGRIEQGKGNPTLSTIEAVAYTIHIDVYELIKLSEL